AATRSTSLRKRLNAFTDELAGLHQGDVASLHRCRVATRRLSELVPVLGLDSAATDKLGRRLGKTRKRLGVVREFDVLALLIEELRERGKYSPEALEGVAAAIARRRAVATGRVKAKLTHSKLRRLAGRLEDVAEQLEADEAAQTPRASAE